MGVESFVEGFAERQSGLKPCPFCGRIPKVESCKDFGYFVKCRCGIEQSTLYAQRCDAVRRWNMRKEKRDEQPK